MLYYRRKIILSLIQEFGGKLTAKSFQKYLFLFTRKQNEKAFDFIPYKYGCFSFQANQDLVTLQKYGYLKIIEQSSGRFLTITKFDNYIALLSSNDKIILKQIKQDFGELNQSELIRYTYQRFPYYAINSKIAKELLDTKELAVVEKQKRDMIDKQLFSIGYEGISLEAYINKLIIHNVHVLCDVRRNALSQKYGFSKKQLKTACEGVGIKYIHVPELGIISEKRKELNTQEDYNRLFEDYEKTSLKENYVALLKIRKLINEECRVAVTCFEKNPAQCHRTRVANALLEFPDVDYSLKNL